MSDLFVETHKAKHLLAHVLAAAATQRWSGVLRGPSGETPTGFYADLGLPAVPTTGELELLTDDMARLLREEKTFHGFELTPAAALAAQAGQPWKRYQIEAIAESEPRIRCLQLGDFVDVCDCAIKDPAEIRALHPEHFELTAAHPVIWAHRGREHFLVRIKGELFPAVAPCRCCRV